ncbi:hypothetical protein HanOQP8_Chr02g0047341 [Helianthus annuus]|nr:hypothetical protein HanOQP8_Chr02g0047341 [Helianthus annuus]
MYLQTLIYVFNLCTSKRTSWSCLQRLSWARLTFFIYHAEKMIFTKFSPQLLNRLSKRFILNLFKTNYELAQHYVDFFRMFFLRLHFSHYGTVGIEEPMGIRVLSGIHFLEVLSYLLPLCNEDTGPVTPALIFLGCDRLVSEL